MSKSSASILHGAQFYDRRGRQIDPSEAWKCALLQDERGRPKANIANAIHALRTSGAWQGLAFDEFNVRVVCLTPPPFARADGPWSDADDARAAEWLQRQEINVPPHVVAQAVEVVARERSFNPLCHYLGALVWDGRERLARMATEYFGALDNRLNSEFFRLFMISAIARAFEPGCKADHMLVLEGAQGPGKSQALQILGGEFYGEVFADLGTAAAVEQIQGRWLIEQAELAAIGRSKVEAVKAFVSRCEDRMRPAYGRRVQTFKRGCVFVGTTNTDDWHCDTTGGRRFWPVRVGARIDLDALRRDRDQLWAEAVHRYRRGEAWHLTDGELISEQQRAMELRVLDDAWTSAIIGRAIAQGGRITTTEALAAVGVALDRTKTAETKRVAAILTSHRYEHRRIGNGDVRERVWIAPCPF